VDISQLETFFWTARLGSITQACKRLNATQSTLSMRLKKLETSLRVTLFDRSHKRLTLTAKGRDLVRHAEKILDAAEQIRRYVADPAAESGTIRVGVAELISLTWIPDLIRRLSTQFPNIVIDMDVGLPLPLMEGLSSGKLDVVLAPAMSKPEPPFTGVPLGTVGFCWVASPGLHIGKKFVTPTQLQKLAFIGAAGNQSILHALVRQWFAENGATIQRLNVCNSLAASASMVMAGLGVSLLPQTYCAPFIKSGKLVALRTNRTFEFEFYATYSAVGDQALPRLVAEQARAASTFVRRAA
jgi:DNA-binding transcriptional LysR family regulator